MHFHIRNCPMHWQRFTANRNSLGPLKVWLSNATCRVQNLPSSLPRLLVSRHWLIYNSIDFDWQHNISEIADLAFSRSRIWWAILRKRRLVKALKNSLNKPRPNTVLPVKKARRLYWTKSSTALTGSSLLPESSCLCMVRCCIT